MRIDRRSLLLHAAALPAFVTPARTETLTDSIGRSVSIPERVTKVFAAGPPASVILYTLAPDLLVGWPRAHVTGACDFLLRDVCERPFTGRLTGAGNTINPEMLLRYAPQVIIDVGSVDNTFASVANRIQEQTGIPYALFDGRMSNTVPVYRQIARLIRREKAAEPLCAYAERTFATIRGRVADIPFSRRPRIYHARGARGLDTPRAGSVNLDPFELLNVRNVAGELRGNTVPFEQLLVWDPDVIIALDRDFVESLKYDVNWQPISAVRNRRVHLAPSQPFGWVNFVPSVNRIVGLWWLAKALYPELFPENLSDLTREFFSLFYHVELDRERIARLLNT